MYIMSTKRGIGLIFAIKLRRKLPSSFFHSYAVHSAYYSSSEPLIFFAARVYTQKSTELWKFKDEQNGSGFS